MLYIKNLQLNKKGTEITITFIESESESINFASVKDWNKVTMECNKAEIFIAFVSGQWRPTKKCNNGFWLAAIRTIQEKEKAKQLNINLSSAEDYYKAQTALFFDVFGELYNHFWEFYDNFNKNNRKVIVKYI